MSSIDVPLVRGKFGQTARQDNWWLMPLVTFLAFSTFIVYSTWAAFQGDFYRLGPYVSPFYSPELFGDPAHAWFGAMPSWIPAWLPITPALLILWAPGGFRFTCYYYRGAYYKAFWADPPSCTVSEPRQRYLGENSFPLIMQNLHRYFLYAALFFLLILAHDVWKALWFTDASGKASFGIGVGTIVLALNVTFLSGYTFGCHSLRHLVGGFMDEVSKAPACAKGYACVSCLNRRHMAWGWTSLCWVAFSDIYVRLCSMGFWHDMRIL